MSTTNLWYKEAITYALHIRSFYDSDGNGMGDINGLIQKLDYLEDLGVNCLSLLPFFASPLKDDGYDISDYLSIHPHYGTHEHFRQLLDEAHKRGMRIVIDLEVNHTSTQHPWFQRARMAAPFTPERDFYVWNDQPDKYQDARIIFTDYESSNWEWDNQAKAYYWHRFYAHQADLNYDNLQVREAMREVIDYWFDTGVDGIRLTSVAFLFEREGTNCENLPEVHDYLRSLRSYVDEKYPGKILLSDANLWPEEAAQYFGAGNECHVNYHFPLMPRLYMALQTEDRYPVIDIYEQTPVIPESCQWALFLRNHDDLILSMVTEEERDFLYRVFAQDQRARVNRGIRRRLAPLLNNDRRKIELLNVLLFSLPGSPVIYYGDEIGMGDNIYLGDRNGVRTPMQWSSDQNAGFSGANPQKLFLPVVRDPMYRYEAVNVELQNENPASLLWWTKNLIALRKRLRAFSFGQIDFLSAGNSKVLAFLRKSEGETILVVVNLSKYSQSAELDLSGFDGVQPVEIFSQNKFFAISKEKYRFTLGPYGYYWFLMEQPEETETGPKERIIPELEAEASWALIFEHYTTKRQFEKRMLTPYMRTCRWFGGKSKNIVSADVSRYPVVTSGDHIYYLLNIDMRYTDGLPETYFLPVAFINQAERIVHFLKNEPQSVICYLKTPSHEGIIIDAIYEETFRNELFQLIQSDATISLPEGRLRFEPGKVLTELATDPAEVQSEVLRAEQSNTSVIYNGQFFFKIYRKLDTDINPDLELVRFLSERTFFQNSPRYGGGIQYENLSDHSYTILGLLQNKIPNQGEAWTAMLDVLGRFYEKILAQGKNLAKTPELIRKPRLYFSDLPAFMQELITETTFERVRLLGVRTAEMHIALADDAMDPDFKPEPFTRHYQRSIYAVHRKLVSDKLGALANRIGLLPPHIAAEAQRILDLREDIMHCFSDIYAQPIATVKTRIHGDYHLGQVLFDGSDFFIIDFEGEPMLSISERRLKRTPFKDVAGMIRSFHYAAYGQLMLNPHYRKEDMPLLEQWARQWFHYISQFYLSAYLDRAEGQAFVPQNPDAMRLLLRNYTLEKAIYEVGYEMNARPEWLRIPVRGVLYEMEAYLKGE